EIVGPFPPGRTWLTYLGPLLSSGVSPGADRQPPSSLDSAGRACRSASVASFRSKVLTSTLIIPGLSLIAEIRRCSTRIGISMRLSLLTIDAEAGDGVKPPGPPRAGRGTSLSRAAPTRGRTCAATRVGFTLGLIRFSIDTW